MSVKKWYTIYKATNDEILTIGFKKECAKNLGFSEKIFHEMVAKVKMGRNKRYIIAVEEIDDDYEETDEYHEEPNSDVTIYGEENYRVDCKHKYRIDENEIFSLYLMKYTDKEIADKLHVSKAAVSKWRDRNNLESLVGRGRRRKRRDLYED